MSNTIHEQLEQLALDFATIRQSGKKNRFPDNIWSSAITIAEKLPIATVCQAIKVSPAYFRKKKSELFPIDTEDSLTFLEVPQDHCRAFNAMTINIESASGHKLKIDGATASSLIPILCEFLRAEVSCCK